MDPKRADPPSAPADLEIGDTADKVWKPALRLLADLNDTVETTRFGAGIRMGVRRAGVDPFRDFRRLRIEYPGRRQSPKFKILRVFDLIP